MAARRLYSELRRAHLRLSLIRPLAIRHSPPPLRNPSGFDQSPHLLPNLGAGTSFRYFSSRTYGSDFSGPNQGVDSVPKSELGVALFTDASSISDSLIGGTADAEYIFPVRATISFLDWFHNSTGLPWWVTIASSALILRISLSPVLLIQLHKMKTIGQFLPKLPTPFPPPLSGKSLVEQFSLFRRERKAIGCPSYLWFLAYFSIQFPCFLLLMTSVRRMSLDNHLGFDSGGCLWFQNLTEFSHGASGFIFPTLVAGLHLLNVQDLNPLSLYGWRCLVSFRLSGFKKETRNDLFGLLAKYYRIYLRILTVPLFVTGFCIPQGSLVYWTSNGFLNIIQHLVLQSSPVRRKLGLPGKESATSTSNAENDNPVSQVSEALNKQRMIPVKNLSPKELVALSVLSLSKGNKDGAVPLLRLALEKDPEHVRALTLMGQTLLQKGQEADAIRFFEQAISKLSHDGPPTEAEDVDLLIQASQWAGTAYIRQGKKIEGRAHLERVAAIAEPEDPKAKAHYYEGLVILASALYNEGRKDEAVKYLRKAAVYNLEYNVYLEQCEKDSEEFVDELVSSRRRDY